ncbi:MAG: MerR family transcriptional regulator [Ilumatobacter sp.]
MFMIGDFAQLARVSARVLRHYDRIGLLHPQRVDDSTGYRFYSAEQLADINRIVALRDLGFGLSEIGGLLRENMSPSELRAMLTLKQTQALAELQAVEQRLRGIDSRIMQLEETTSSIDLVRKRVPAMTVWTSAYQTAHLGEALDALSCMVKEMVQHIDDPTPPYGMARWTADFDEEGFPMEFAVPVDPRLEAVAERDGFVEEVLPAVDVVSTVRSPDSDDLHVTNAAIGRWIENESAAISGPVREVLLADPALGALHQIVEVQFPITSS